MGAAVRTGRESAQEAAAQPEGCCREPPVARGGAGSMSAAMSTDAAASRRLLPVAAKCFSS
ncbi:hypothetical protein STSU_002740 [Streptomyces tsukubensis NRRL18488]|uniref:Uncharacterized protein n=1 Tax=Streptomyces tsukubensis (strain DSM 42081 / NBRC 108919 / NRRL 18488 / 9993) TaxID=1114943 RepID=I2NAK5_STRT9|nr:hypothetical protein [Streptomyces tsukubensis NRRL18488]QKM66242.1 hypothetical protein STSU_002740 [Streptomyces tsukubensis NRRL18488]